MTERSLDIVLVDGDEVFLKRLAGAISAGRQKNIMVRAFSETRKALNLLKASQPDALVIGEKSYNEEFKNTFTGKTIVLTEDDGVSEYDKAGVFVSGDSPEEFAATDSDKYAETAYSAGSVTGKGSLYAEPVVSLCRYGPAGGIVKAIGNPVKKQAGISRRESVHTTGVMSFCEAEYKNAYALTLAAMEAVSKRVLYINLDEFSPLRGKLKTSGGYTISDALYAYRQGLVSSEFIRRSIGSIGGFDYIAPTLCADDLAGLKAREINRFICDIAAEYGYDRVILDVGYALDEPWEVFKFCDDADIPFREGMNGRLSEFGTYMHQSGKSFVLEMIRQVELPGELLPYREDTWFEGEYMNWLKWLEKDGAAV